MAIALESSVCSASMISTWFASLTWLSSLIVTRFFWAVFLFGFGSSRMASTTEVLAFGAICISCAIVILIFAFCIQSYALYNSCDPMPFGFNVGGIPLVNCLMAGARGRAPTGIESWTVDSKESCVCEFNGLASDVIFSGPLLHPTGRFPSLFDIGFAAGLGAGKDLIALPLPSSTLRDLRGLC